MNIKDSGIVKNKVSVRNLLFALALYSALLTYSYQAFGEVGLITIGLFLIAMTSLTIVICKKEMKSTESDLNQFKRNNPFSLYGVNFGNFQHIFYSEDNVNNEIENEIKNQLELKTLLKNFERLSIEDIDNDITKNDPRKFLNASFQNTERGTNITLMLETSSYNNMRSVRWWALVGGYVDKNKYFNFVAYSPVFILFWIIPYFRKNFDILEKLRTIYSSSYNDFDVLTAIKCIHETIFCAMTDTLEKHDIDTTELRIQKTQVMNLNVSGGKVDIGNVVQGSMNKISSKIRKAA